MRQIRAVLTIGLAMAIGGIGVGPGVGSSQADPQPAAPEPWDTEPAAGMFLVAQRSLHDPFFSHSVILILKHGIPGTEGLIINRPSDWRLSDLVNDLDDGEEAAAKYPVFFGGPLGVHRVFMLIRHSEPVASARHVTGNLYFSDRRKVLDTMLAGEYPGALMRLFIGYASWTSGQLALELARGSWHLVGADAISIQEGSERGLWDRLIDHLEPLGIEVRLEPLQTPG
jgi:putative transcriptional regulator